MQQALGYRILQSRLWIAAYILTGTFAVIAVWIVGHRGIFFFDQSGVFDGGWRLVQGQVIYRDFYVPYGPVIFLIQSIFFRIFGVDFSSMVLAAAAVNCAAVLVVMWIVRLLLTDPDQRPTAVAAGLLTAVWFQTPTGTLWFEQVGFLFNLLALAFALKAKAGDKRAAYFRIATGVCLVISILSKQTAGFIFIPVVFGAAVIECLPDWRRAFQACLQIVIGMLTLSVAFIAWLWLFSSPAGFWQSVVVMSRFLGANRASLIHKPTDLIWLKQTERFVYRALILLGISVAMRRGFSIRNGALITWIILSYAFLQNLFAALTRNDAENEIGYLGLINGLAFGFFYEVFFKGKLPGKHPIVRWAGVFLTLAVAYGMFGGFARSGWGYSMERVVLQFPSDARFTEQVHVKGASRLRWGEPTMIDDTTNLSRKDFEDLNTWLDQANANFFVFPDSTLLYGLHKKVSPQPWVYFMPQHSFLLSDLAHVDETIQKSLEKNHVTVVVLEKTSWGETRKHLDEMPKLRGWIDNNFEKTKEFGLYEVWTLRSRH